MNIERVNLLDYLIISEYKWFYNLLKILHLVMAPLLYFTILNSDSKYPFSSNSVRYANAFLVVIPTEFDTNVALVFLFLGTSSRIFSLADFTMKKSSVSSNRIVFFFIANSHASPFSNMAYKCDHLILGFQYLVLNPFHLYTFYIT